MRFLLIGMSILGAAHLYVWARLVQAPDLPMPLFLALSVFFVLAWLSIPTTLIFGRQLPPQRARFIVWPGYVWLGTVFLLLVATAAADVARVALHVVGLGAADAESALFRARAGAGFAAGAAGLGLAISLWLGRRVAVRRVEVPIERLPCSMQGTTIVQLSDVHVGPTIGKRFIERVVDQVNALAPDLVVITGDLVDGSVERLREAVAPLGRICARHGVYFVTGNHEYYSGAEAWCAYLRELGVRVLRNERVSIGPEGDCIDLAGIDDYTAHHFGPGHGANLRRALSGRDPARPLILLAHQPRAIVEAEQNGVTLQISGHTHGGQIWPFNFLVRLQQPVTSGLVRFGRALIYVSNGTGYWGPPMRLGSPAEITLLTLVSPDGGRDRLLPRVPPPRRSDGAVVELPAS